MNMGQAPGACEHWAMVVAVRAEGVSVGAAKEEEPGHCGGACARTCASEKGTECVSNPQ